MWLGRSTPRTCRRPGRAVVRRRRRRDVYAGFGGEATRRGGLINCRALLFEVVSDYRISAALSWNRDLCRHQPSTEPFSDSTYSLVRRHRGTVLASNIRIALAVAYLVLLVWRSRVEGHIPEYWWIVIAVYFLSIQATRWAESLWNWWQLRQTVRSFGMLEPAAKEAALTRLWSASARHHLAELVKDEGEPEIGDSIERYPFTRSARRETTVAFWVMAGLSAILFGALIAWPHRVAAGFGWFAWTLAGGGTVTAAILRHRMHFLESTLEVSRFGLAQVDGEGTRR